MAKEVREVKEYFNKKEAALAALVDEINLAITNNSVFLEELRQAQRAIAAKEGGEKYRREEKATR